MTRVSGLFIAGVLLLAAGCQPEELTDEWRRLDTPVAAPDFTLAQLNGPPVTLSALKGQVVVLEFWATWCGPCRMSMPSLEAIHKEQQGRPVTVLLIDAGESDTDVRRWAGRRFTAPILLDAQGAVRKQYGVYGIPKMFVIDREGRIAYEHSGYGGGLEQSLRLVIKELLSAGEPAHA